MVLESAYLFGAICPAKRKGAALALPFADTDAMQLHFEEISRNGAVGAHVVLIFERAGWHTRPKLIMPKNVTPIWLPSRARTQSRGKRLAVLAPDLDLQRVFETCQEVAPEF